MRPFPYCEWHRAGGYINLKPCRAQPSYEVIDERRTDSECLHMPIGTFCEGHALTVCAVTISRVMRPLWVTVEVRGKDRHTS